jgi:hypothetical protein
VIATYLTAAVAAEALLTEGAHDYDARHPHRPAIYTDKFRLRLGVPGKYKRVMGETAPEPLERIWRIRNAVTHSDSPSEGAPQISKDLTVQGAANAVAYVRRLQSAIAMRLVALAHADTAVAFSSPKKA